MAGFTLFYGGSSVFWRFKFFEVPQQLWNFGPSVLGPEAEGNDFLELRRVPFGYFFILAALDLLEEGVHVLAFEGRPECAHLIENATKRPNITLETVRLVVPDLGTGVVRSPGLGVGQVLAEQDRDVHVSDFWNVFLAEEDVGRFQISVDDFGQVEGF